MDQIKPLSCYARTQSEHWRNLQFYQLYASKQPFLVDLDRRVNLANKPEARAEANSPGEDEERISNDKHVAKVENGRDHLRDLELRAEVEDGI